MTAPKQDAKADQWSGLEALAKAAMEMEATPTAWFTAGQIVALAKIEPEDASFIAAANPSAILNLIAAARASTVGMEAKPECTKPSPKGCDVELREAVARLFFSEADRAALDKRHAGNRAPSRTKWREALSKTDQALALINQARQPEGAGAAPTWVSGAPVGFRAKEWFIAETTYGDRVVLTALPEEYTYDFKTADQTYIRADRIKRWMPFPDSEFSFSTDNADGLSDDRAVTVKRGDIERAIASQPGVRKAIAHGQINMGQISNAVMRVVHAPPAGKDLAGEVERLRAVADFLLERDEAIQGDAPDAGERTESARQILALVSGAKR